MMLNLIENMISLVQAVAWGLQATIHYLNEQLFLG